MSLQSGSPGTTAATSSTLATRTRSFLNIISLIIKKDFLTLSLPQLYVLCQYNPDFVTPKNKEFKYCIKDNGDITKIDKSGSLVDEEYKIDELIEEKKKKGFASRKKQLVEFKIDEDEFFKYSCDAKKEKGEVICKGESERALLGIRPEGYFLNKGLKEIEDEKWNKSIEYLSLIHISEPTRPY